MRLPRILDQVEIRVLGCLLEKQQSTPEYYPLTLNSLVAACNQKSNREPVMELSEPDVRAALERLRADVLVMPVEGARTERWEHRLDRRFDFDAATKAIITVLFLRGPQTAGELRTRSERMHNFQSLPAVEEKLRALATDPEPLIVDLGRAPGQKESRWAHTAAGEVAPAAALSAVANKAETLGERVAQLEAQVTRLSDQLERLFELLGERPANQG